MKNPRKFLFRASKLVSAGLCLLFSPLAYQAGAQTAQYWDNNGASAATSGTWDTTTANWAPSATLTASTVPFTNGNFPIFAAGSAGITSLIITVPGAVTCEGFGDGTTSAGGATGAAITNLTFSGAGSINLPTGDWPFECGNSAPAPNIYVEVPITGPGGFVQHNSGALYLMGTNTYSGGTWLTGGQLLYYSNSASFGTGPITNTSTMSIGNIAAGVVTIPNAFVINNGGDVFNFANFGGGPTICSGPWTLQATPQLKNNQTTDSLTISGVISDGGAGFGLGLQNADATAVGSGAIILSGQNTYTGPTSIGAGEIGGLTTVSVSSINSVNTPAQQLYSSLGVPSSVANGTISIGATIYKCALVYTGPGETSDRVINLIGTTGTAYIEMDGVGPLVLTSDFTATGAGVKTLTLQGTSVATNTIAGAIVNSSSATAVTKTNTGTWVLTGLSTFTGPVTNLGPGLLSVNSIADSGTPNAIGYGTVLTLAGGGTFQYTGSGAATTTRTIFGTSGSTDTIDLPDGDLTLNGQVKSSATFTLNKTSGGTLTLGGAADNSFLGMNVNGGTVVLNKTSSSSVHGLGEASSVGNGGTLQLSGSGTFQINNNVPITVNSGGVLDLNSQSTSMGSLSLAGVGNSGDSDGGALINSAASTTSILTNAITLAAAATIGGAGNITLSGPIGGILLGLTYAGSGELTLQGVSTYTGGTIVSSGILDINGAGSIVGNVSVSGTGTLELDGNTALSSVATLGVGAGTTVNLNFAGNQTIGALVLGSTSTPAGTYSAAQLSTLYPSATFEGGGNLVVTATYWDPGYSDAIPGDGGNGSWDSTSTNWFTGADTTWPLDGVAFFAGTFGTVTLNANLNADALTFTTAGYTIEEGISSPVLTLDGATPSITVPAGNTTVACNLAESDANPLIINGPGTLTLSGANTYAGGTTLNSTTLSVNAIADSGTSAMGNSGAVNMNNGSTLSYTGGGAAVTARGVTVNGAATATINVPGGSLEIDAAVKTGVGATAAQIYTKTGAGTLILGGSVDNASTTMAINQGEVILNKTVTGHGLGGGTSTVGIGSAGNSAELQLSGSGYDTELYSGCLLTVNGIDGFLDLNGQSDNMSTLTLSGSGPGGAPYLGALINSAAGTTSVLTNAGSGIVLAGNTTIGGPGNIRLGAISGAFSLTNASTGTLTLSNASTYSGGTTIGSGGTLALNNVTAAGTGAIAIGHNGLLNLSVGGTYAYVITTADSTGVLDCGVPSGNTLLTGSLTGFTGTINVGPTAGSLGQVVLNNANNAANPISASATWNIANGATLDLATPYVTDAASVIVNGPASGTFGALRLDACNQTGPVLLNAPNCSIGNGNAGVSTISGVISDNGHGYGFTLVGPAGDGGLTLTATNTYTGATVISNNTLTIGGGGCLGVTATSTNYATNIVISGTFNYASSAAQILSGVISGTGALAVSSSGPLTVTGTNTYTGPTILTNSGKLILSAGGCLGVTPTATNYLGNITNNGALFDYASSAGQTLSGVISGTGALAVASSGTLTLSAADTYTGATLITNDATLALAVGGSINNSASLSIAAGATFDVSAYSAYASGNGTTLKANGTGIGVGTTAATIKGNSGGSVSLSSEPIALTFTPQNFTGDATHPPLYVSQGALTLGANAITVNNAGASPLGLGTYSLIQVAGGSITTNAVPTVTVTGNGLAAGTAAAISLGSGSVNLVVASAIVPAPAINHVTTSGNNLIFSGTNGSDNGTYYVLTSTNVTLPLSQWTSIATNSFTPTGTFSVTNVIGTNLKQFFTIEIP